MNNLRIFFSKTVVVFFLVSKCSHSMVTMIKHAYKNCDVTLENFGFLLLDNGGLGHIEIIDEF